jgi:hypothetical protein
VQGEFAGEGVDAAAEGRGHITAADRAAGHGEFGLALALDHDRVEQFELLLAIFDLFGQCVDFLHEIRHLEALGVFEDDLWTADGGLLRKVEFAVIEAGGIGQALAECIEADQAGLQAGHADGQGFELAQGFAFDAFEVGFLLAQAIYPGLGGFIFLEFGVAGFGELEAVIAEEDGEAQQAQAQSEPHPAPYDQGFG